MPYTRINWVDEIPQSTPVTYTIKDDSEQIIHDDITIELKTPVVEGTPLTAANLNHLEDGIVDVETAAAAAQNTANQAVSAAATAQNTANQAVSAAATAQNTANAAIPKSVVTTNGDLIRGSGPAAVTRIPPGTANHVLMMSSGIPDWGRNLVLFTGKRTNTNWDGDSKSINTYTIAANSFHADLPNTAKALILSLSAQWTSGTPDGGKVVNIRPAGSDGNCLLVRGHSSNYQDAMGIVPLNANGQFDVVVIGGTANVAIDCWGYIL